MSEKTRISVVIPVYGCRTALVELYFQLKKVLSEITENFEVIMVNDASPDNAWATILELATNDSRVKGLNLSRNFGQHYAITAGLDFCSGEWVVIMDCDLQDRPDEILNLYAKVQEGYDIVLAQRQMRQDSFFKKNISKIYYHVFSYLTNTKIDPSVGTFRILSGKVVQELNKMREASRFFGALTTWVGFRIAYIKVVHAERHSGKSSYNFKRALNLALEGVLSFSDRPLRLTIKLGLLIVMLSSLFMIYKIINLYFFGTSIIGWSSIIASIFFTTGIIVFVLGMVGLYIGKIFQQVKQRPLYIIKETTK